ncbi:MAG: hypothetical protein KBB20_02180 [Bacteroidales bacterium]|jgi:hypothetical protein|nr:hypothetical protein [Bacteroidales bacterium]OQC02202.1 MAG: hypothetical protein BWX77_01390 [Bacteroidetes bacterium ADurb.Bin090]MBP8981609.1 hypothetical protein [Bacteroidales bacterium]NLV37965.1 hypothetical protein [Bacteroidales bacterium]HNZ80487.1 hypothetical protein [Bacteroidales bacterium]
MKKFFCWNKMSKDTLNNLLFTLAAVLILISSVLVMEHQAWARFSFATGVVLYIAHRALTAYKGDDFRLKRLNRMFAFNGIVLILAVYLMFRNSNSWVAILLIVAVIELYTAFRSASYQKENEQ